MYWISTGLLSLALVASAASYLWHPPTIEGIRALGLPEYLRLELAVLKLLAVVALLVPQVPLLAKDWAYAGAAFFFLTAIVAHAAHGDSWTLHGINGVLLSLLIASRATLPI